MRTIGIILAEFSSPGFVSMSNTQPMTSGIFLEDACVKHMSGIRAARNLRLILEIRKTRKLKETDSLISRVMVIFSFVCKLLSIRQVKRGSRNKLFSSLLPLAYCKRKLPLIFVSSSMEVVCFHLVIFTFFTL